MIHRSPDFFRTQAVAAASRKLDGEVILAQSATGLVVASLVSIMIVGAFLAAALVPVATRQSARGWTVAAGGSIMIMAEDAGLVDAVFVRQGQHVERGAVLVRVTPAGDVRGGSLVGSLNQERAAASSRVDAQILELAESRETLQRQIQAARQELESLDDRASIQEERTLLARHALARSETLAAQGFLPARELEARRAALIDARDAEVQIRIERSRTETTRRDLEDRLRGLPAERIRLTSTKVIEGADVEQRRIEAERLSAQSYRASIAGDIATLPVRLGQPVRIGDVVAVLNPPGRALEAELQIPASAIGRVQPGQAIQIRYDAFPFQRFGVTHAQVVSVSTGVLPASASTIPGLVPPGPFYIAKAKLSDDKAARFSSGLLVSAEIVTDNRTLLARFLDALRTAGRAIR